jgi:hypothetical protein
MHRAVRDHDARKSGSLPEGSTEGKAMRTDATNPCSHDGLYWFAAPANETGWRCTNCGHQPGEPPGFSPQHDRSHLRTKVRCIVHDLHDAGIIYVSNVSDGANLTTVAVTACRSRNLYDSVSIARVVLELEADDAHAKFWRGVSEGILAGKDQRHRCACGKLATQSCGGHRACCHDHMQLALGASAKDLF